MVNGAHDERSTGARVCASVVYALLFVLHTVFHYQEKKRGVRVRTGCAGYSRTEAFARVFVSDWLPRYRRLSSH